MAEVAEIEPLRPGEELPRGDRLFMSKRKSCRPCSRRVGTVIACRCDREERAASALVTAGVTFPWIRSCSALARVGSQLAIGTACARILTSPVFGTPFGLSAVPRLVHVIAGTIALKGTPATAAFQTSSPPSESPTAPIWVFETSACAENQS
jgi:hypothetical protein